MSARVAGSERQSEIAELVSEVMAHLLRATSVCWSENMDAHGALPASGTEEVLASGGATPGAVPWLKKGQIDERDSRRDGRVIWLVDAICNRPALFHRYEDVRRRDRGGKWDGAGYPLVQADDQMIERLRGEADPAEDQHAALHAEDSQRAWRGLVEMVERQFGPRDDVPALVRLLAEDPDVQEAFGSQWPIARIARALGERDPRSAWNDDRVENAKRRLTKWIAGVKRAQGLDAIDLRALLVRYARENEHRRVHR